MLSVHAMVGEKGLPPPSAPASTFPPSAPASACGDPLLLLLEHATALVPAPPAMPTTTKARMVFFMEAPRKGPF